MATAPTREFSVWTAPDGGSTASASTTAANALNIVETHDQVRRGERPQVIGDGSETKHFVHVSDVARANTAALASEATDTVLNISGPSPVATPQSGSRPVSV